MKKKFEISVKDALNGMVKTYRLEKPLQGVQVKEIWAEKMGTTVNKLTKSIHINNGTLFLLIESAPLKQELSINKENIKKIMNKSLGSEIISQVVIY